MKYINQETGEEMIPENAESSEGTDAPEKKKKHKKTEE